MIKFRYKRKEPSDRETAAQQKNAGTAIQKQKIEAMRDRELLPPKDMMMVGGKDLMLGSKDLMMGGSVAGVRHNTLPRSRPPTAARPVAREAQLSQTTIALFRVS